MIWTEFKEWTLLHKVSLQFKEFPSHYHIFGWTKLFYNECILYKFTSPIGVDSEVNSTWVLDFETNFKSISNLPLEVKNKMGSPIRVVSTSQPNNTTEKWKGIHLEMTEEESIARLMINFPAVVYLRGGEIYSDDCSCKDYINVDVVWTEYPEMIIYPNLLENIYMIKDKKIEFLSNECMEFPPMLSLQITYYKDQDSLPRCVSAIANFFESNPL